MHSCNEPDCLMCNPQKPEAAFFENLNRDYPKEKGDWGQAIPEFLIADQLCRIAYALECLLVEITLLREIQRDRK